MPDRQTDVEHTLQPLNEISPPRFLLASFLSLAPCPVLHYLLVYAWSGVSVTTREEENGRKSFVAMRVVVQAPKLCSSINQTDTGQFALAACTHTHAYNEHGLSVTP